MISLGLRLSGWWGVDADEVDEDDELVEMVIPRHRHGHGDLDVPSTLLPRSEVYLPRALTWKHTRFG